MKKILKFLLYVMCVLLATAIFEVCYIILYIDIGLIALVLIYYIFASVLPRAILNKDKRIRRKLLVYSLCFVSMIGIQFLFTMNLPLEFGHPIGYISGVIIEILIGVLLPRSIMKDYDNELKQTQENRQVEYGKEEIVAHELEPEITDTEPVMETMTEVETVPAPVDEVAETVTAQKEAPEGEETKVTEGKRRYCRQCGSPINSASKKCSGCGKQYFRLRNLAVPAVSVVLALSVLANIGLYIKMAEADSEVERLTAEVAQQAALLEQKEQDETDQKTRLMDLTLEKERLEIWQKRIIRELRSKRLGYASEEFYVNKGVVLIGEHEPSKQIELFTRWNGYGGVSIENTNTIVASVAFDEDSWDGSTTLTISPYRCGTTTVTFTNDRNDEEFDVLIIVVEDWLVDGTLA